MDRVEGVLNSNREMKKIVEGKDVKVFNIGQPGAGFPHFAFNYRMQAKLFKPDLVIVNYIELDFPRRFAPAPRPGS